MHVPAGLMRLFLSSQSKLPLHKRSSLSDITPMLLQVLPSMRCKASALPEPITAAMLSSCNLPCCLQARASLCE